MSEISNWNINLETQHFLLRYPWFSEDTSTKFWNIRTLSFHTEKKRNTIQQNWKEHHSVQIKFVCHYIMSLAFHLGLFLLSFQNHSWKKKEKWKRKREREGCLKSLWSTELSQPSCLNQTRWWYLKTPVLQWEMETLPVSFLLSSSYPPSLPHFPLLALSLTPKQAASHWSCKLCLRRVYAPFLPKHLLSLTNYSRINYKPFRETDSHQSLAERETHTDAYTHKHERFRDSLRVK